MLNKVKFDDRLTFKRHIDDICRAEEQNLNLLSRRNPYMEFAKKRTLDKVLF